ncbi:maltose alpha-D-glucosyltransferase [Actinokineospora fastidiosa]|uniref:maltose alpha-D-glucosyltransferase n=1 Tax=Actinokineospora fastidiosa TaxID=1816 RepID=UPI001E42044D|nr:maltose alpha-D-glucosyltransferase [Actinokineospora fastidiosa]
MPAGGTADNKSWFKSAVFYQLHVRAFHDSNGDGVGDLEGLRQKLDYLEWLGVTCIWLLPIYESPLGDGGYDVSDYETIQPKLGTTAEFRRLVADVHRRGMHIITDFVLNHTSVEHAWFQASRSDPDGPYGDFYVWSDTNTGYPDARIIFNDSEHSNWAYDPVRKQYYWHRFYTHQADLNFENERVQQALLDVMRFWLDLGVDGFRLDAVPFLFESEGTNCENLPGTHQYLKRLRAEMDRLYPGRLLLAEADEWPNDVLEYFGDPAVGGDECDMAFHFPLTPRVFIALRREERYPISEILAEVPKIPDNCQWAIFLRNHDELALSMVSEEEYEYMHSQYAPEPRMRVNTGIRRRMAPLLDNDQDKLRLVTALLFSFPGSPVLYYGDEIGMGDNIWLPDRDGLRTPMQWSAEANAGFSECAADELYLPVVSDPEYACDVVNVADQRNREGSLLRFVRSMIAIRKAHPEFGLGSYEELDTGNPAILAFVRRHQGSFVLCVNNLSSVEQSVRLDIERYGVASLTDCQDHQTVVRTDDGAYELVLPRFGFRWLQNQTLTKAFIDDFTSVSALTAGDGENIAAVS